MKIGLLGYGVVGSGVGKIIDDGLTWEVRELEVARILVKDESELKDPRMTLSADEILNDPEIDVIVECMGGLEPAHTYVRKALENGKYVVTSNKKMLASYCSELFDIARKNNVTVHYEAACGGGIPWMASLDRTRRVDDIISFRGIFNGTTNYILERMSKEHSSFADKLKEDRRLRCPQQGQPVLCQGIRHGAEYRRHHDFRHPHDQRSGPAVLRRPWPGMQTAGQRRVPSQLHQCLCNSGIPRQRG